MLVDNTGRGQWIVLASQRRGVDLSTWLPLTVWLVPLIFLVALAIVWACWVRPGDAGTRKWPWIDAAWIASSAVTLFLLILSTAGEPLTREASEQRDSLRIEGNNLLERIADLHAKYCLGPSPVSGIGTERLRVVCTAVEEENMVVRAAFASGVDPDTLHEFSLPSPIPFGLGTTPQEKWAQREWEIVRSREARWNEAVQRIRQLQPAVEAYEPVPAIRLIWFYLYAPLVAMRLGRSLWDIRRAQTSAPPFDPASQRDAAHP